MLFDTRHDRDEDDGTNAKPFAEANRQRRATVDFIIVYIIVGFKGSDLLLRGMVVGFYGVSKVGIKVV